MSSPAQITEALVREEAQRRGYHLKCTRWRLGSPDNAGKLMLVDARGNIVLGRRFDASLEDLARHLGLLEGS